jgi:hypothetical protein
MCNRVIAALALATLAAGCSPVQDTKAADAQIATFHQKLNAGDFAGIYSAGSPQMKAAVSQADMVHIYSIVHGKLGNFQSGRDTGWSENVNTSGHFLTVNYSAVFDRGEALETFIFRIDGGQARLTRYDASSRALLPG